ncbi:TetR family transcriptional regulator C-terminal domain-containing protein [Comamonas sp. JC664]|uniref:TetR family transcriptional regulator C-terminal domain-containing protein n=1 Tax=Comamonas sp. JC664 TaxID=2801917 RepID=UPI003623AFFF
MREKFEFARTRPYGSQLFTKEMIAGAPFAASAVRERIARCWQPMWQRLRIGPNKA